MKLHAPRPIDPLPPSNAPQGWTHPLKLHRRDPTVPLLRPDTTPPDPDQKDVKAQIDLSVIAPYGGAQKAKKDLFKPKTKQVFHSDPQELQLRNEERTPWVLEDFEGKNTWVGTLEGGGASGYALFLFDTEGFKLVPVDRTYRFSKKGATQVLSAEEAEEQMKKRSSLPRWILKDRLGAPGTGSVSSTGSSGGGSGGGLFTVRESRERAGEAMEEDLDYDAAEMFEDDEENPILEGDEEANKAIEERVRREMRGARNFESKEDEIDEDINLDDLFEAKKVTKEGKRTKRYLTKLEGQRDYESDEEEENPYASEVYSQFSAARLTLFRRKLILKQKQNLNKPKKKINPKSPAQQAPNLLLHPQPQNSNPVAQHLPLQPRKNPKRTKTELEQQHLNPIVTVKRTTAEHSHQVKLPHPVDQVPNLHLENLPQNPSAPPYPEQAPH